MHGRPLAPGTIQRTAVLPALRQHYARLHANAAQVVPGRIQEHLLPLHSENLGGHGDPALLPRVRRNELQLDVQVGNTAGNGDVKREHVLRITRPFHGLVACCDEQPGELVDGTARSVIAGQPLGILQNQGAGLHGDRLVHAEDPSPDVRRVDTQRYRTVIRSIPRRRHLTSSNRGAGRGECHRNQQKPSAHEHCPYKALCVAQL